uniref:Uncharacterized protein n=1 Tax=Neovison vison TaxID=452646 RepID=A0A8C7EKT1_NEOVI
CNGAGKQQCQKQLILSCFISFLSIYDTFLYLSSLKPHAFSLSPVSSIPPKMVPFKERPERNNKPLMLRRTPAKNPTITQTPWLSWQEARAASCCEAMQDNARVKRCT